MAYAPHTPADRDAMLAAIGVASIDDLFADIPGAVRAREFAVPAPLPEQEVRRELRGWLVATGFPRSASWAPERTAISSLPRSWR